MPNTSPTDKTKNRIGWLFCLVVLCFVVMVSRLFYIQIIDGANLQSRALSQWTRSFTVTAKRGRDRGRQRQGAGAVGKLSDHHRIARGRRGR